MATPTVKLRIMWQCWILVLCATGIFGAIFEPKSISIDAPSNNREITPGTTILRFACPVGFFRLNRKCYYLSAGTATWQQAHFHCKDRNSTLAAPDKKGKDRKLRKYLMGDQFAKLERWIGGIYDWHGMTWNWGLSGEKILFHNFEKLEEGDPKQYAWHCIVMDPRIEYKWRPTSCVKRKHYICEVPAGRIERRRRYGYDSSSAPQNQRMKPRKGKKYTKNERKIRRRNRARNEWKGDRDVQNRNEQWANGVKLGSRPPANMRAMNGTRRGNRKRHRGSTRLHPGSNTPKITQILSQGQEYGSYLGDGPARTQHQALSEDTAAINQFHAKLNDLSLEEILLKT
ncbi:uncharacterized protein [Venturia canescens]|uniref:uncharacterized protein n=1 Tax=Venturia canescens TaxID=32260 RepID=UPI001C9BD039|nr:uncharacterized protein LOC122410811 [Venturia canescens]